MRHLCLLIIFLFILPIGLANTSHINISISEDGLVTEDFLLSIDAEQEYDSFDFFTSNKPLSVAYDGEYSVQARDEGYVILFVKDIVEGNQEIAFTLLYDDLVEKTGNNRLVFRSNFDLNDGQNTSISLTLPQGQTLSGDPGAAPVPDSVSTDGQRITLIWNFVSKPSVAVFFTGDDSLSSSALVAISFLLVFIIGVIALILKKRMNDIINHTLSDDEQAIVSQIKSGVTKQKDIAQILEFSKSKMSKVLRKLEEKGLVTKKPYFKTYELKLKKIR